MNDVCGNIFWLYCTKTNGCVHQTFCCIAWMSRGRSHSLARNAPVAVISSKDNQAHSTSIFMSYLHLYDLYTTLSESCIPFQTNRHALSHRNGVCVMVNRSPHPTCPNLDSTDLYDAALDSIPWAMKLANTCVHCVVLHVCLKGVQPCATSLCGMNIFTHCWIDGDQKSFIWMKSEQWTVDRQVLMDNEYLGHTKWNIRTTEGGK